MASSSSSARGESSPLLGTNPRGHGQPTITGEPAVEQRRVASPVLRPNMVSRLSATTTHTHSHTHDHHNSHSNGAVNGFIPNGSAAPTDPPTPFHIESHIPHYDALLRDIIIGFSDGLTVPFALTAGLSSLGSTQLVIMGGLAELFSGMISMGLGAYLAAATERAHWESEHARECSEVDHVPDIERAEIYDILSSYGVSRDAATPLVRQLTSDKKEWVRFMMDFELRLPEPDVSRAWVSAVTMGVSYFVGGLVPMVPYFVMDVAGEALWVSVGVTVVILLGFGYVKNWVTIRTKRAGVEGALQTLVVGALAAGTSYLIVRLLDRGQ